MTDLASLIAEAETGSRELDLLVGEKIGARSQWEAYRRECWERNEGIIPWQDWCPEYTTSIDDVLAHVVPEGAEYTISTLYHVANVELPLNDGEFVPESVRRKDCNVVLAVCEAALRYRAALRTREAG